MPAQRLASWSLRVQHFIYPVILGFDKLGINPTSSSWPHQVKVAALAEDSSKTESYM